MNFTILFVFLNKESRNLILEILNFTTLQALKVPYNIFQFHITKMVLRCNNNLSLQVKKDNVNICIYPIYRRLLNNHFIFYFSDKIAH